MAKVIYGDGTHSVEVHDDTQAVIITDASTGGVVTLSTAAFEEVVLGWQRHLDKPDVGTIVEVGGEVGTGLS